MPDALWDGAAVYLCTFLHVAYTERHTPVNDEDAVQTAANPMCCGIWPSGLRRIYAAFEARGEEIKYTWYGTIRMTQFLQLHCTNTLVPPQPGDNKENCKCIKTIKHAVVDAVNIFQQGIMKSYKSKRRWPLKSISLLDQGLPAT